MGKVSALIEVKPTGPDVDLDELLETCEAELPEGAKISDSKREAVGFGISKLLLQIVVPDDAGGADKVATVFEGLEDVQSVDVTSVSRL